MNSYSNNDRKKHVTRETIIGLGEDSIRKNYYPELQDKIASLERMSSRNRTLIMAIPDVLLVSDAKGNITPFSTTSRAVTSHALEIMRSGEIMRQLRQYVLEVAENREGETVLFEMEINDRESIFEARLHPTEMDEILIIIRDMTDRVQMEQRLRRMAETDHLTGLSNRRRFEEHLEGLTGRKKSGTGLLLFDIDGLKVINETLGHMVGDQVIVSVASLIRDQFLEKALTARIGGNEFGVLLLGCDLIEIEDCIEVFKHKLRIFNELDQAHLVDVSYGYAYQGEGVVDGRLLYQEADNNLYQHKLLKEKSSKSGLVKTLMKTLEAKDYITEGHADRMTVLAEKLGSAIGFSQSQLDRIRLLTKFHDLGKVGIPDSILKKPGALNKEEWQVMKTHTMIGERIASTMPELKEISRLILRHHEYWDGTGYPSQIKGEKIPIECRVLSIVDAYDAMTNERPYRKAITMEEALAEIKRCAGTQFDPNLTPIFDRVCREYEGQESDKREATS